MCGLFLGAATVQPAGVCPKAETLLQSQDPTTAPEGREGLTPCDNAF